MGCIRYDKHNQHDDQEAQQFRKFLETSLLKYESSLNDSYDGPTTCECAHTLETATPTSLQTGISIRADWHWAEHEVPHCHNRFESPPS